MVTAGALAGRDEELALFADVVAAVRAGAPRVVLVRGPRGIGKSALIEAALAGPPTGLSTVLKTTCAPHTAAFGAVCGLLASVPGGGLLDQELSTMRSFGDFAGGEDQVLVRSILHRLHQVVVDTTGRAGALVLVIDDVQHCDAASLRWLDFVLRRAANLPLLVVLGLRTEELTSVCPLSSGLLERHGVLVVDLGPLPRADAALLATNALGAEAEAGFAEQCVRVADGNPGALLRLAEVLNGRRVPPVDDEASRVAAFGRLAALRDVLAVLSHTDHALAVARAVGALGTTDGELVAMLAEVPVARVHEVVGLLRRSDLLDESGLMVQVAAPVLEGLSARQREELRRRAAWLLSVAGYPAVHVAEQLLPLPEHPEPWMLDLLREAARHAPFSARRRFLFAVYRSDPGDPQVRVDLAATVGRDDPNHALELLREAMTLTGNVRERASIAAKLATAGLAAGRVPDVLELVDATLCELAAADGADHVAHRDLVHGLTAIRIISGLTDLSTIAATVACAGTPALADSGAGGETAAERLLAAARGVLATVRGDGAHIALACASTAAGLAASRQWMIGSFVSAFVYHLAGERTAAITTLGCLIDDSRAEDDPRAEYTALALRALIRAECDELSSAHADASRAVELSGDAGTPHPLAPRVALASVLVLLDEADKAEAVLGEPLTRGVWEYHEYLMTRARIRWARGDADAAVEDLTTCGASLRAAGFANPVFAPWWVDLALLLAELGRADEAWEAVEHGTGLSRRWGTRHSWGLARLAQGAIAHHGQAPALLSEAVELLAAASDRVRQVQAEHLLGLALASSGDLRAGRAHLRHAVDLAVRWGQRAHAVRARTDLEGLGGRMGRRDEVLTGSLTPSERNVVAMAASGANNREIAESLVVSLRTVEIHLTSAYRKLGVSGRTQLAGALAAHPRSGARRSR